MDDVHDLDVGDREVVRCRFYTSARRHPLVIGNIQGLRIPPVTPAQLGVAVGSLVLLAATRIVWAHFGLLNGLVLIGVPLGLAYAVRAVRVEGRAPWRAAVGWFQLWSSPREGVCLGRRDRPLRSSRYRGRAWVGAIEGDGASRRGDRLRRPLPSQGS